jgi:hypothetical protein
MKLVLVKEKITLPRTYSITGEAEDARNVLVLKAQDVAKVDSPLANTEAGEVCRDIRKHLKSVEATRQELTAPLLEGQRLLKALSDDHIEPLKAELSRIEGLATAFQLAEQERIAKEERERLAEVARLETERQAAIQKAQETLVEAPAGSPDDEAAYEQSRQAQAQADALADQQRALLTQPVPAVQKARGQQTRKVLKYEVLDIKAVYAARPELCTLEIKPSAVLATCDPAYPIVGLRLWWEDKSVFTTK